MQNIEQDSSELQLKSYLHSNESSSYFNCRSEQPQIQTDHNQSYDQSLDICNNSQQSYIKERRLYKSKQIQGDFQNKNNQPFSLSFHYSSIISESTEQNFIQTEQNINNPNWSEDSLHYDQQNHIQQNLSYSQLLDITQDNNFYELSQSHINQPYLDHQAQTENFNYMDQNINNPRQNPLAQSRFNLNNQQGLSTLTNSLDRYYLSHEHNLNSESTNSFRK
ncbi:hypothetical protein ABPG74_018030 [Tetrahymena malaccensis]